ncbi:MAG: hypothetical protein KDA28_14760, partial [Phycisphaerales bacterium]|nr:hypothetical protein [Phycisphaerales bacterium]
MRLLIALLALSLLACGEVSPVSTPPPEAPPAPRLAVPTVPRSPVVALQGEPLVITRTAIELSDGPAVAALVDGRVRAEDRSGPLSIPALRDRVAAMPADWAPTVAVHPDVPFATGGQAGYTLGNAGRTSLGFVARVGEDLVVIPIWLPNA